MKASHVTLDDVPMPQFRPASSKRRVAEISSKDILVQANIRISMDVTLKAQISLPPGGDEVI